MQKFKIVGKPLLGEKQVEGKKEKERRIMPSLVAIIYANLHTRVCAHTLHLGQLYHQL